MHRICLKITYNLKDSSKKKLFIMKFIENILELFSGVSFSIYTFLVGGGCRSEFTGEDDYSHVGPVYTIPFSYENGMEMLSYENGIV